MGRGGGPCARRGGLRLLGLASGVVCARGKAPCCATTTTQLPPGDVCPWLTLCAPAVLPPSTGVALRAAAPRSHKLAQRLGYSPLVVEAGGRSLGCTKGGSKRKRANKSGYRARMATPAGRKVIKARRKKGRKNLCPASHGGKNPHQK